MAAALRFPSSRSSARRLPALDSGDAITGGVAPLTRDLPLEPALDGAFETLRVPFGAIRYYRSGGGKPLLLIHSVNAAANAYEMKPLYDHYSRTRTVYALDLPGFGFSDRLDRIYTPDIMIEAIMALVEEIRRRHGAAPIDALALSLSCEFLARAASWHPSSFRSVALISPTGLASKRANDRPLGSTFAMPSVRKVVAFRAWGKGLFRLLVSKPSIRFFLQKTWGSAAIDEGLFAYDYRSAHQPGAEHAPFSFLSGYLFSADMAHVYRSLTGPVWMAHGIRGDFVDYRRKAEFETKPNWTIVVLPTGAMAHFERLDLVTASYDVFLDAAG